MSPRQPRTNDEERKRLLALCGELAFDDGIDPRHERRGSSRKKKDRKVFQLCRQVFETVSLTLAGDPDALLRAVQVVRVEPAPDASRLRVVVTVGVIDPDPGERGDDATREDLTGVLSGAEQALARCAGRLRSEVAAAISRRRTPELEFTVLPPELCELDPPEPGSPEPDPPGPDADLPTGGGA